MDWARDRLGNDVPAWKGGISAFGLECPTCRQPVRRRAGTERRPHFAHYSHRANPECENYFPASGYAASARSTSASIGREGASGTASLNCGLLLGSSGAVDTLGLWLRIPSIRLDATCAGTLRIQSELGVRRYDLADLQTARLVPLLPQVPLGGVTATSDLLALGAHITLELESFGKDRNLFYADERGGRIVVAAESLEWGSRYRLLAREVVAVPVHLAMAIGWNARPKLANWHVYEFALPTVFSGSKQELPAQIAALLGRKIRAARPRIFVVHPSPHHIDLDGTYVYPSPPGSILIRRNADKPVVARVASDAVNCSASAISEEWVSIAGLPDDGRDCVVSIDGDEQVVIRVGACEFFRPEGIVVRCGSRTWELVSTEPCDFHELYRQELVVELSHERVAAYLARLNPDWQAGHLTLTRAANEPKVFRGGSFGELLPPTDDPIADDPDAAKPEMAETRVFSRRRWIEGAVESAHGPAGLTCVRRYFADPDGASLHHLGVLLASPLMPHIQAAHDQAHKV